MTDSESNAAVNDKFTPREIELLGWAMQSLKSGPPEIDYENLARLAKMTNPKSAANAWSKIKTKLLTADDGTVKVIPKTPKKGKGKTVGDGEEGEATAKKTPGRKRAAKTDDNEGSPKKRGRKPKAEEEKAPVKDEVKDEEMKESDNEVKEEAKEEGGSDDAADEV